MIPTSVLGVRDFLSAAYRMRLPLAFMVTAFVLFSIFVCSMLSIVQDFRSVQESSSNDEKDLRRETRELRGKAKMLDEQVRALRQRLDDHIDREPMARFDAGVVAP